jgi:glycerol kinase
MDIQNITSVDVNLSYLYVLFAAREQNEETAMPSLLGIDNGLTVTKAVIFDTDGTQLSVARRRVPQSMPRARWVERDMAGLWQATAEARLSTDGRQVKSSTRP